MKSFFTAENAASKLFWTWTIIELIPWLISMLTGDAIEQMLPAVDYAEKSDPSGIDRNEEAQAFVLISFVFFVISTIIGAILIRYTEKSRLWAFVLLVPFSFWSIYYCVSYPFDTSDLYAKPLDTWTLIFAIFSGAIWLAILFFAGRQYQRQSNLADR